MTNKITHIKPEETKLTYKQGEISKMVQDIVKEVANEFIKPMTKVNTLKDVESMVLVILSMIRKEIAENQEIIDNRKEKK